MSGDAAIETLEDAFHRTPRCAVHPGREARRAPCERCGGFACEECFGSPAEERCAGCRARVGGSLAWERADMGGPLARAWATIVDLVPEPSRHFEGLGEGAGVLSAIWFSLLVHAVSYGVPALLCAPCVVGSLLLVPPTPGSEVPREFLLGFTCGTFLSLPVAVAIASLLVSLLQAGVYHLAAWVAGGAAPFTASLRACLFLSVLTPLGMIASILGRIPLIGLLVTLAWWVASLVWQTFALAGHARGAHKITDQRAWLVGATPALASVALFAAAMLGLILLVALSIGAGEDGLFEALDR